MKRIFLAVLALILFAACARAEMYTLSGRGVNAYYECEDFEAVLPADVQRIVASRLQAGDRVIGGTRRTAFYRNQPGVIQEDSILLAVRREGKILLMSAVQKGEGWTVSIESDSFIPPDAEFGITVLSQYDSAGFWTDASMAIVCANETYGIACAEDGALSLTSYVRQEENGDVLHVSVYKSIAADIFRDNVKQASASAKNPTSRRIAAWTMDTLPKSIEDVRAWDDGHPVALGEDEAFINGVNLRSKATRQSKSWGTYSARVTVLGSEPGVRKPWYNVRIGSITGWVSGDYLSRRGDEEFAGDVAYALDHQRFARADQEMQLRDTPDGEEIGIIPAGAIMHLLYESDGWAHVILPQNEIAWETDWNGVYGFVRADEVTQGISIADVTWK